MIKPINPLNAWTNAVQLAILGAEAQAVISMRLMGMAGVWSVTKHENNRMMSEKLYAVRKSMREAAAFSLSGGSADEAMAAAIKPLRQRTRANSRRLAKRGPKRS